MSEWAVQKDIGDNDGWRYAPGFPTGLHSLFEHKWSTTAGTFDVCRTRRWYRRQKKRESGADLIANSRRVREAQREKEREEETKRYQQRRELLGPNGTPDMNPNAERIDVRTAKISSKGVVTAQGTFSAQQYVERLHQDNSTSLDNAIKALSSADDLAASNLTSLQKQTEQMKRIDQDLNDMNQSMQASDRIVKNLESWTGRLGNFFSAPISANDTTLKQPDATSRAAATPSNNTRNSNTSGSATTNTTPTAKSSLRPGAETQVNTREVSRGLKKGDPYAAKQREAEARFSETEVSKSYQAGVERENQQLDDLMGILSRVKDRAEDTNRELRTQQVYVDHLTTQVDKQNIKLNKTNDRLSKIS
jgi:hypothetical protein